jgi:hypothetical protein
MAEATVSKKASRLVPAKVASLELGIPYSTLRDAVHRRELGVVRLGRERPSFSLVLRESRFGPVDLDQEGGFVKATILLTSGRVRASAGFADHANRS